MYPVVLDERKVCCGNWFLEMELADIMTDPEARRTTALFIDPRCNLPLTQGVFDYATVKVIHATDPEQRSWVELKYEFGSHSFRIGGKNDMERANVQEVIQLETMWSTNKVVARGYNRQEALLDPRVEAVLHYTADENIPVLRHTELGGRRLPPSRHLVPANKQVPFLPIPVATQPHCCVAMGWKSGSRKIGFP